MKRKASKAQQRAVNKYTKNHYDRISVLLPLGQKNLLKKIASHTNESVNAYITNALNARIQHESGVLDSAICENSIDETEMPNALELKSCFDDYKKRLSLKENDSPNRTPAAEDPGSAPPPDDE